MSRREVKARDGCYPASASIVPISSKGKIFIYIRDIRMDRWIDGDIDMGKQIVGFFMVLWFVCIIWTLLGFDLNLLRSYKAFVVLKWWNYTQKNCLLSLYKVIQKYKLYNVWRRQVKRPWRKTLLYFSHFYPSLLFTTLAENILVPLIVCLFPISGIVSIAVIFSHDVRGWRDQGENTLVK